MRSDLTAGLARDALADLRRARKAFAVESALMYGWSQLPAGQRVAALLPKVDRLLLSVPVPPTATAKDEAAAAAAAGESPKKKMQRTKKR